MQCRLCFVLQVFALLLLPIAVLLLLARHGLAAPNESAGCGRASARALAQLLGGRYESIEAGGADEVLSLRQVKDILASAGVSVSGRQLAVSDIEALHRPMIVTMSPGHAVVLDGMTGGYARIIDNGSPKLMRKEDFARDFAGVALVPEDYSPAPLETTPITDFGTLAPGQSVTWSPLLENASDELLRIEPVTTERGCKACGDDLMREALDLAPRDRRVIEIRLTAPAQGVLEEHLPLRLPGGRVVIASCTGEVNAGFVVSPPVLDLGRIGLGDEHPTRFTVRRALGLLPQVESVKSSVPWIIVTSDPVGELSLALTVRLSSESRVGAFKESVTVKFVGGHEAHVAVQGEILPYVYTVPSTVVFGRVPLNKTAEWTGDIRGKLADQCRPGIAQAPAEVSGSVSKTDKAYRIHLVFTPKREGLFSDTVVVRTGIPGQDTLSLRVLAFVDRAE